MKSKVRTWYNGISLKFAIKTTEQKRKELLENPLVKELMEIAYKEGVHYTLNYLSGFTFEELIEELKR